MRVSCGVSCRSSFSSPSQILAGLAASLPTSTSISLSFAQSSPVMFGLYLNLTWYWLLLPLMKTLARVSFCSLPRTETWPAAAPRVKTEGLSLEEGGGRREKGGG